MAVVNIPGYVLQHNDRSHPHAGIVLIGDFNKLFDAALLSYRLKQFEKSQCSRFLIPILNVCVDLVLGCCHPGQDQHKYSGLVRETNLSHFSV